MDRRGFLRSLGLATGAAIAFPEVVTGGTWFFPESVIEHTGRITAEWVSAEALVILKELYSGQLQKADPFEMVHQKVNGTDTWRKPDHIKQFGADLRLPEFEKEMPLDLVREAYLRPAMTLFANQLNDCKPKNCFPLLLPGGIEYAARATDTQQGLDLRFVRAYDINSDNFVNRFDIAVA